MEEDRVKTAKIPFEAAGFVPARLDVDLFKWTENKYRPETAAYVSRNGGGLHVRMVSFEKETLVRTLTDNGPVWCDSCMEMFLMPFPEDDRYINFEINPAGAMVMDLHRTRRDKEELVSRYKKYLGFTVFSDAANGSWGTDFTVPFAMLREIYGCSRELGCGSVLYANFYKCGDETRTPHFGMWNEIDSDRPDFHRPEFFGRLEML
jgi:hypothetical protein